MMDIVERLRSMTVARSTGIEAAGTIEHLRRQLDEARKDAARYHYIWNHLEARKVLSELFGRGKDVSLDDVIDAAMEGE